MALCEAQYQIVFLHIWHFTLNDYASVQSPLLFLWSVQLDIPATNPNFQQMKSCIQYIDYCSLA